MGVGELSSSSPLNKTYEGIFNDYCSLYLSYGMSYEQYWNGDCIIVKFYREKHKRELEHMNFREWLSGAYIYNALVASSPLFNAFSSRNKPFDYLAKPFSITKEQQEAEERERYKKQIQEFADFAKRFNAQRKQDG